MRAAITAATALTAAGLLAIAPRAIGAYPTADTICDRFGSAHQGSDVVMNDRWNPTATGQQCVGATSTPPTPGGQVSKSDVLNWMSKLQHRSDNRVVSGFFGGYSGSTFNLDQTNQLKNQSGPYPGLLACDYANWVNSANTQVDSSCNDTLKDWWHNGGLVSVGIHMPSPTGGNFGTKLGNFGDLTNSGTAVGRAYQDSLTKIGDGLSDLKNAGVVVLWRPFHEMNGDWFWWGNQDADTYKNVWNYTYNYLVNTRGLDNLIWVYAPDCSRNGNLTDYYPGGDKVDVVGLDCYTDNPSGGDGNVVKNLDAQYNQMLGLGKPFAFTEAGPRDQTGGSFDWKKWIDAIQQRYPKTTYFLAWNDKWSPPQNQNSTGLMNHPWVINRGEIDLRGGATPPTPPPGSGGH
ncbi:beta-mannosidase [Planosporangium flavigriseum]|nr:glycosyl hydrolase [Planosporangium flavigriseum]NJC64300.1 beta-mannosidase [Planosporangium flavigriseum]